MTAEQLVEILHTRLMGSYSALTVLHVPDLPRVILDVTKIVRESPVGWGEIAEELWAEVHRLAADRLEASGEQRAEGSAAWLLPVLLEHCCGTLLSEVRASREFWEKHTATRK